MRSPRPQGHCGCCGKAGAIIYYTGWRTACYIRWLRAGKPADGPPPPKSTREDNLTEYEVIRGTSTPDVIAGRLGLSVHTIRGYETELRRRTA